MAIKKEWVLQEIEKFHPLDLATINKLDLFVENLINYNEKFNLIGKSTIEDIWNRHILDSAQLIKFIDDKNLTIGDFGSGAGLPAIILSILGVKEIHLIEKSFRKCQFLQEVKNISQNKVIIHNKMAQEIKNIQFDIITSRAFAPLDKLLQITKPFCHKNTKLIFPKGKNIMSEISQSKMKLGFSIYESLTSKEGKILVIPKY